MTSMQSLHREINTIAKQAGVCAGSWLAINLSSDYRTPSEFGIGVREGGGYC